MNEEKRTFSQALEESLQEDLLDSLEQLPSEEELAASQSFSRDFEKGLEKELHRRSRSTLVRKVCRAAACLALTATVAGASLMMFPNARTALQEMVVEWFDQYTSFSVSVPDGEELSHGLHWRLRELPEGFSLMDSSRSGGSGFLFYMDEEQRPLHFSYHPMRGAATIALDNEHATYHEVEFLGNTAHLMERNSMEDYSSFLWYNSESTFLLSGRLSGAQLMELARSVEPMAPSYRPLKVPEGYLAGWQEETRGLQWVTYRSEAGGTILFQCYDDPEDLPKEAPGALCWESGGLGFRLEAPQLSAEELSQMAESVTNVLPAYTLGQIPEHFSLCDEEQLPSGSQVLYWDDTEDSQLYLQFSHSVSGREISSEFFEPTGQYETIETGRGPMLLRRDTSSSLLWRDENTFFEIESPLPPEELIRAAESVILREK